MKKSLLAGIFLLTTFTSSHAQNLLQDGGFENTKTYNYTDNKSTDELPRISALGKLGSVTETNNPVMEAETVVQGVWYRKSANSGYNHGKIITSDYSEGQKSLNLSISAGSSTTKLDTWDNNTAIQFVNIDRTKQYVLKFKAKNLIGGYPVFAGIAVGGGYEVSGSDWVTLSDDWEEYSLTIDPTQHPSTQTHYTDADFLKSGVVFGNRTAYGSNNKSLESSILIDDIRLYEKGTEPGEDSNIKDCIINGDFETGEANSSIVTDTDPWGSDLIGKWSLVIKSSSTGTGIITTEDTHEGNQALKIDLTNISARYHFFLAQEIQNLTPAEYTFVMWMKASKADIPVRVDFSIDNDNIDVLTSPQTTATEWTRYEVKVDLSDKTAEDLSILRIRIRPNCTSSGSVQNEPVTYFFDEISFTTTSSEVENPGEDDGVKDFISNGDFETGEPNSSIVMGTDPWGSNLVNTWGLVVKNSSTGTGTITTEDIHGGNQALKVDLTNIDARYRFFLAQEVQNLAPSEYTFVMWMKASKAGIPVRVDFTINNNTTDFVKSAQTTATEWTRYEIKVDFSSLKATDLSTCRISIRPNCTSSGSVQNEPVTYYFDDISFKGIVPDVILFQPEPYLQSKTSESILINWRSEEGVPTVEYGIEELNLSATGTTKAVGSISWSGVRLTGLLPDTEYQYRCRIGDNISETYKFRTLPGKDVTRKIRFLSFGDSHEASSVTPIREAALKFLKQEFGEDLQNHFDFITCTGDIIYNYGQYENEFVESLFTPNKDLTNALPMNIAAGNHDFEKNDSEHSYFYDFMDFTDLSDAEGDAKGKYYAQQVGNALYIYLNTNRQYLCPTDNSSQTYQANTEAQLEWLKNKLTAAENDNTIDMIFIFGHHGYRYEMWSAPDDSATRKEIAERLFPVFENSTKIKMYMYGHTHSVERGILELKNGKSITLFLNGNGGSYPDYFGKYSTNIDYPEIHRNSEFIGFAITEVDPVEKSYQTTYYGVSQRRPVNGASYTVYVREYDPAQIIDQWGTVCNADAPAAPTIIKQEYNATDGIFSLEASSAADMMSAEYQIIDITDQAIVVDTIIHRENIFGVTGYFETDGKIDLERSYLPVDLNAGIDLSIFSAKLPTGNYKAKIRYRDDNLNWSEWSDISTAIDASEKADSDVVIAGGTAEVVIVSEGGIAEIYSPYGALLSKTALTNGENRIGVAPNTPIIVRVVKDNKCTVKNLWIK